MSSTPNHPGSSLNEFQKRRLRVSCEYIDKLLLNIEDVLHQSSSRSAFPKYQLGVTPAQRKTMENHISGIRAQLLRILEGQHIDREQPPISPAHAIHVALTFIEISAEELYPRNMRGYGSVSPAAVADLNQIVGELLNLVTKLDQYVAAELNDSRKEPLQNSEKSDKGIAPLESINHAEVSDEPQ